jgi:glycosyltransferase involved in cell wall biosynthesis
MEVLHPTMKILQVCPKYYPDTGGVEEHVKNISERLAKKFEVSVFATDPAGKLPKEELVNNVKVIRFKSWAPCEAYYFSTTLKKYLAKYSNSFDIVHAHNYGALPALYAAQSKGKNKLVFTPHYIGGGGTFFRNLLHTPYKVITAKIFQRSDKVVCVSNYEKSLIVNKFKVDEEKIVVIPNGVNFEEFRGLKKIKKNYNLILCVSRLEKYKGVQYAIMALPKLDPSVFLEIVGKGPYKKSLIKLAKKLGVDNRVRFSQDLQREELLQKYAMADVFILLSKREAMPITIVEALAAKVPCIVSKIPFLLEWVDNKNCFGIKYPIDVGELVNLLNKVIGIKIKGVKLTDWNDVTRELEMIYESLL